MLLAASHRNHLIASLLSKALPHKPNTAVKSKCVLESIILGVRVKTAAGQILKLVMM